MTAYYLLPGPEEWERESERELPAVVLVPVIGVAGFALASGRLAPVLGNNRNAALACWAILALGLVPMWRNLPRVAIAGLPTVALLSGRLDWAMAQEHIPLWLGWIAVSTTSGVLAARQYFFSVLPTVILCLLLARTT